MSEKTLFGYQGRRALVVGGATGMGAAAAKAVAGLGAEVVVMDRVPVDYPVDRFVQVDLSDQASVDEALTELDGPIDAVFSAAGVAAGPIVMKVNFIAHRHLLDSLLAAGSLKAGSAICFISSLAGLGWQTHLDKVTDFLSTPDWAAADEWVAGHEGANTYMFSKQAVNAYVARQAYPLASQGIRINAICPGPTDTPLARSEGWLNGFGADFREATGLPPLTPEQMGDTMAFLNGPAASGISGVTLFVDGGHIMSSMGGSWEAGGPVVQFLMTQNAQ
jgi:NAD(P)-dependent dehydrogenase (short-subunit alcohol dehydrogenase family)